MKDVTMPALGMAMTEGLLIGWLKQPGDHVAAGEAVAEIETDKSAMELESPADGTLGPHLFPAGAIVPIGTTLSQVVESDDVQPTSNVALAAEPEPATAAGTEEAVPAESAPASRERHQLSPRARRLAREAVRQAAAPAQAAWATMNRADVPDAAVPPMVGAGRHRALIAAKVSESWHAIPHFAVTREIRADALLALQASARIFVPTVTLTDLLLRALARAFARTTGNSSVNLGLAVATPQGVAIPILSDVLGRTLTGLAEARSAAVERAIVGRLLPGDIETPADSTLSNLGAYDIDSFTGVIYPGQTSLLTIGRARPRIVVEDGAPVVRTTFFATLNVDHRTYDGADAARLLAAFADAVQDSQSLVSGRASDA